MILNMMIISSTSAPPPSFSCFVNALHSIYSDGVGNCSQELATKCAEALGSDQKAPSAVQIRMGG
jgi:hypothetical protein